MGRNDLVIFGPPGAGKGTQASAICRQKGSLHLSTGDILREAVAEGTPTGLEAKRCMEEGRLVPDEVVVRIIADKLNALAGVESVLFDGFPRTEEQARRLDEMLEGAGRGIAAVVNLDVPDEDIIRRLGGRRVCRCGATYHVEANPPAKEGICDDCGQELIKRKDDVPDVIANRLKLYHEETCPLLEHYRKQGLLKTAPATGSVEEVTELVLKMV